MVHTVQVLVPFPKYLQMQIVNAVKAWKPYFLARVEEGVSVERMNWEEKEHGSNTQLKTLEFYVKNPNQEKPWSST